MSTQHIIIDFLKSRNVQASPFVGRPANQPDTGLAVLSVAKMDWFGASIDDDPSLEKATGLSRQFELKGVSASEDQRMAGAFIAETGQQEKYYQLGDVLPDNAGHLIGVFVDHVTIKSGETIFTLGFAGGIGSSTKKASGEDAKNAPSFILLPDPAQKFSGKTLTQSELVTQFIDEPDKLLAQAGLSAVKLGQKDGYKFDGNDEQGVFSNTGIQAGDVIKRVNNTPVGDPQADRLLIPTLAEGKTVDFDVLRGTQHFTFHYNMP